MTMILNPNPSIRFLFWFTNFLFLACSTTCTLASLCHGEERSALLQFKDSFVINCQASSLDPLSYPKLQNWRLHLHHDCCSWDGVSCDYRTGHVIGLDLSSSCLYGSINSTSTLFHLLHLRSLNLAFNNFNHSQIPSHFVHLSQLTSLNLSSSYFHGQIPPKISQLSKLSAFDLSSNDNLVLKNPDFDRLVDNLTSLVHLKLDWVDISSSLPLALANLSSLKSLRLSYCELYGKFPIGIFQLPHLQNLQLIGNPDLNGYLPEFNVSSPLQILALAETSFSGELPESIGNLASLKVLFIPYCGFFGQVPNSLGNLLELKELDLRGNNFEVKNSSSLSWIGKLTRLFLLGLSGIRSNKVFPLYFANLTQLNFFFLTNCEIDSQIPPWLMNMTQLVFLDLPDNQLQGPIPDSVFQLTNLQYLSLYGNKLSGTVELSMFLNKLRKLTTLYLSRNNLSLLHSDVSNSSFTKLLALGLGGCSLTHFPRVLREQDQLQWLDLSCNSIRGQIPKWVWNASKDTLEVVDLSYNFLIGFEQDPILFPSIQVKVIYLSGNKLRGSLPIPPPSVEEYIIDDNNLTGHISPIFCNLSVLRVLDLSHNNLTGTLPPCFANSCPSIQMLNLEGNKFHGNIPDSYTHRCNLKMLSLDSNNLEGEVPRSLSNCTQLEFLSLGNNQINDVFPSWLGSLRKLKVLILRSNRFHGRLENHNSNFNFPKLCIIDISYNNLSGKLPAQYFLHWNAMKIGNEDQLVYMNSQIFLVMQYSTRDVMVPLYYIYSMTITNKGTNLRYYKIIESLVAIDFSSNNFEGGIPRIIGNVNGLRLLNLSNNNLGGEIPTSFANLTELESMDISRNNFVGQIPQELTKLGFLAVFNVSYNHLMGPVPHGKQFDAFDNSSYLNNSGLCGSLLSRKCENLPPSTSSIEFENGVEDSDSFFKFSWQPVVMGYGCGLIVGTVIGHIIFKRNFEWFMKTFRIARGRMARGTHRR